MALHHGVTRLKAIATHYIIMSRSDKRKRRPLDATDAPTVPNSHTATRAAEDEDQTLIYDVDAGDGAWIQGNTVNPENL